MTGRKLLRIARSLDGSGVLLAIRYSVAICLVLLLIAGCRRPVNLSAEETFERGIAEFHARYNAQEFGKIYDSSLSYYRSRYTRASSREALAALHKQNGKVLRTKVLRVRPTPDVHGMIATGVAVTTFENGVAEEIFSVFHASATDEIALFWYQCGNLNELLLSGERSN